MAAVIYYVYEPKAGPCGEEIPAFTIYRDGEPIAFTNPAQSREEQELVALAFLATGVVMRELAKQAH